MNKYNIQDINNIKKGQQLSIGIAQTDETINILKNLELKSIDIRLDWKNILQTINKSQHIQKAMETAYQDFQEGHKLKDFKYRQGINGAWCFQDIHKGRYPYTLTTTSWLDEYENKEWILQANHTERDALRSLDKSIEIFKKIRGSSDLVDKLNKLKNELLLRYPPRPSQPETWRPHQSAFWTSYWVKTLAKIHYKNLTNDWKIISSNNHSIVAGFKQNKAYLIDIILLTTDIKKIINHLSN